MSKQKIAVAKYLEQQLAMCGKSQREVAEEIGYTNPNIITMFKNGATKIPVNKAGLIARALGVDPIFMLRLLMSEYMPEAWAEIETILSKNIALSGEDIEVAHFIRGVANGFPIDISIADNRVVLETAVKEVVSRDKERGAAAVRRLESLPKNSRNK